MEKEKFRRRVEGDVVLFVRELGVLLIGCGSLVDLVSSSSSCVVMDDDFEFPTTCNMEEGMDMDMDIPEDDDPVSPILRWVRRRRSARMGSRRSSSRKVKGGRLPLLAMKLKFRQFIILGLCLMEPSLTLAEIAKHLSSSSLANSLPALFTSASGGKA
ncbi:hypothetical protein CUMW_150010 [Citrus unshiu]|uniref:Uncharacterized protein n=1 Tax=Citrus unshiu TaxID=55188 RepID=A0A2H5PMI7_CITUN|nr:hypothetical protein CUMW_150010 [Citrus unshiu]